MRPMAFQLDDDDRPIGRLLTAGTPNASDDIYQQSGGQTLLTATEDGEGYAGTFEIGLQVA